VMSGVGPQGFCPSYGPGSHDGNPQSGDRVLSPQTSPCLPSQMQLLPQDWSGGGPRSRASPPPLWSLFQDIIHLCLFLSSPLPSLSE
jgi:hypothetical protein